MNCFLLFSIIVVLVECQNSVFTAKDLNLLKRVSSPSLSPNKKQFVFSVNGWNYETNKKTTNLYLGTIGSNDDPVRLAPLDNVSDNSPTWTADGKFIIFLSSRAGSSQLWQIEVAHPEKASQISFLPVGIDSYKLSSDSKTIIFSSFVYPSTNFEQTAKRSFEESNKRSSKRAWDSLMIRRWDDWWVGTYSHVFTVDIGLGKNNVYSFISEPVDHMFELDSDCPSRPFGGSEEYDLSPDGKYVSFTTQEHKTVAWSTDLNIFLVYRKANTKICVSCSNKALDTTPLFSPDSKTLAFTSMKTENYESDRSRLSLYDIETQNISFRISEAVNLSFNNMKWSDDQKTIFFTSAQKAQTKLFKFDLTTKVDSFVHGTHAISSFDFIPCSDDETKECLIYLESSLTTPHEIYMTKFNKEVVQLTHYATDYMKNFAISTPINYIYKGADGEDIQAWLFKPANFVEGKKYPLLVVAHGGPESVWEDSFNFRWNAQTFVAQGHAAVFPNIHGSTSFTDEFREAVINDWGGKPYWDIMMLIDSLPEAYDWIDGSNLAALGASYGGFMVNWINSQTTRFKCLVCHDGKFDTESSYYYTEELFFVEHENLGCPFDVPKPESYIKHNPMTYAANMKTPELIFHGSKDYRIPDISGISTFTNLKRRGYDARLVIFPDENHWVTKPNNAITWYGEIFAWLDLYLEKN